MKFHWLRNFTEPVNMKYVNFARKVIKHPLIKSNIPSGYEIKTDGDYIIKGCYVTGFTVNDKKMDNGYEDRGATFFSIDTGLIRIGESYYPPLKFSIPKSQLKEWETDKEGVNQNIKISEWAYENCFLLPYNKIYENWGEMMLSLFRAYNSENWDTLPSYLFNPYRNIIEEMKKIELRNQIAEYKKKDEKDIPKNKKEITNDVDTRDHNKTTPIPQETLYTYYIDGSGNLYNNEKRADYGHFSVYLKNTGEKWKRREDRLTSNQAELLGTMSAIDIASQKGHKNVLIYTDSRFVVGCTLKKESGEWTWGIKSGNVMVYVSRLRGMLSMIPNLRIERIKKEKNFAHAV